MSEWNPELNAAVVNALNDPTVRKQPEKPRLADAAEGQAHAEVLALAAYRCVHATICCDADAVQRPAPIEVEPDAGEQGPGGGPCS